MCSFVNFEANQVGFIMGLEKNQDYHFSSCSYPEPPQSAPVLESNLL